MTSNDAPLTGAVSTNAAVVYHRRFVPTLFGQFPPKVLDALDIGPLDDVLDVGCGTGIVAAAARHRVADSARVIGLDPNPAMLAVAEQETVGPVEWIPGTAESLPLDDDSVDVVVSQFALMFFADPDAAMAEAARVLRPGGRVGVVTWTALPSSPGFEILVDALRDHGCDAAAAELEAPFTIGTPDALADRVAPTFPDVEITTIAGTATFASVHDFVAINLDGWTMDDMVDLDQRRSIEQATGARLAPLVADDGALHFAANALLARASVAR